MHRRNPRRNGFTLIELTVVVLLIMLLMGFLFTAGQIAIDPASGQVIDGDVRAQTERVMSNLAAVIGTVNATWKDIVKTTVFVHDMNDFPAVNEVYGRALGDARPARSTVQVSALPRGVLVEIEAVVAIP